MGARVLATVTGAVCCAVFGVACGCEKEREVSWGGMYSPADTGLLYGSADDLDCEALCADWGPSGAAIHQIDSCSVTAIGGPGDGFDLECEGVISGGCY